jgi:hypothetical protein
MEDARRGPLSHFGLHCGERFRYRYDFTADWTLDIRLEKALPLDASAEAELPRRKTALEPGIIWSAWIATSINRPSKNSALWLRPCGAPDARLAQTRLGATSGIVRVRPGASDTQAHNSEIWLGGLPGVSSLPAHQERS